MIRKRLATILALGTLFTGMVTTQASAFANPTVFRYVVTFHDGVDASAMASNMVGSGMRVARVYGTLFSGVAVDLTPEQASALAADPNVALVESDARMGRAQTQDGAEWALTRIDQRSNDPNAAYNYPASAGMGVAVYIVDSGLVTDPVGLSKLPHQEIAGRAKTGYAFVSEGDGTEDCLGHGTHVAGTIAGTEFGVAKLATVIPARVLDCSGWGSASEVIAALDWIQANRDRSRPTVVNISLIGPAHQTLDNVVNRLFNAGVTVVAAAGNDGTNACAYSPARAEGAITVGST
ncbi:MAG: S8 family serine peptidase, partial [Actinomycetota bacterium]